MALFLSLKIAITPVPALDTTLQMCSRHPFESLFNIIGRSEP
jgi:hypothetical protein